MTVPAKRVFSLLIRPIGFLPNDTSQLKMLYGYRERKYCQYSSQRSFFYEAKKRRFNESLVVMLFEFLIVLGAGPCQLSLIRSIRFYSRDVNRAARDCVINEWFFGTVLFFVCVYRQTIEFSNYFLS